MTQPHPRVAYGLIYALGLIRFGTVSYTHLDVYKRQDLNRSEAPVQYQNSISMSSPLFMALLVSYWILLPRMALASAEALATVNSMTKASTVLISRDRFRFIENTYLSTVQF